MESSSPVKSVTKAMVLLDRIALGDVSRQGMTLTALAHELDIPQNTAHNLLKSLIAIVTDAPLTPSELFDPRPSVNRSEPCALKCPLACGD